MNFCSNCGARLEVNETQCRECGLPISELTNSNEQTVTQPPSNASFTGFTLALISLFLPIPYIDIAIGIVALIVSNNGLNSNKRGLATAGIVISVIAIIGSISLLLTDGYNFF